jgi:hypothetical protein
MTKKRKNRASISRHRGGGDSEYEVFTSEGDLMVLHQMVKQALLS